MLFSNSVEVLFLGGFDIFKSHLNNLGCTDFHRYTILLALLMITLITGCDFHASTHSRSSVGKSTDQRQISQGAAPPEVVLEHDFGSTSAERSKLS
jgi:hypothetical protein